MLQDLPPECLRLIVGYLTTASSIINLVLTSRHFYSLISADDYVTLKDFVQNAFPSIKVSPLWREAAIKLTSRTRAWDRRAFIARECYNHSTDWNQLSSASNYGFVPAIDSYETNAVDHPSQRKEILAHSAAGRIMIRVNRTKSCGWRELSFPDDQLPNNDILDLQLMRPHQQLNPDGETIIFRRANGEVSKVETNEESRAYEKTAVYALPTADVGCMAISDERNPCLALCTSDTLHLYTVHHEHCSVRPSSSFQLEEVLDTRASTRCSRFLPGNLLAIGRPRSPIQVYDVAAIPSEGSVLEPLISLRSHRDKPPPDLRANVLESLHTSCGGSPNLLLSGWSDGVSRLYDIRTPQAVVSSFRSFRDSVDDGQIMSLVSVGLERFLAGSSQNGCLKTFDLRIPGTRPYSRADLPGTTSRGELRNQEHNLPAHYNIHHPDRREINVFIAPRVGWGHRTWSPIVQQPGGRQSRVERYRGAIYSLSSPSAASPTVYAGITDHVIQLDSVSTDDVYKDGIVDPMLRIARGWDKNMLDFSCYERPRTGHEMTDTVLLRQQMGWSDVVTTHTGKNRQGRPHDIKNGSEPGWDERWRAPNASNERWQRTGH